MTKKVLLTTPCAPFDVAWGEDMMDLLTARLARGHDIAGLRSELPTWGLYLIAENIQSPSTVLEYPHWEDFLREVDKGYDVIGIQLKTLNTERTARMVKAIRQHSPKTEIVIGGYGVSALREKMPGDVHGHGQYIFENADHLCRDEGVRFMRNLLGEPADRPITQYHMPYATFNLPGVRSFDLKIPAILVSLGCPSACEFCNTSAFYHHKKIYVADPEQTFSFMKHHVERLGVDTLNVTLFDEDLFLNQDYVRELGRLLRADKKMWGVRYVTFGSVKALSAFAPEELRECGVGGVWVGVESGITEDEHSKTGYKKRDGTKSPTELFNDLHRCGIETIGSMILGFDFHTPENIESDIDYFVNLKPMFYQIAPLTPCPGTKLYRDMQKSGRLSDKYTYQSFHIWKEGTHKLANFEDGDMKHWFDVAHEKLRTVNGPPTLQFCELNLRAHETFRKSGSEYLRYQADLAKKLAIGALPLVRAIGNRAPSPAVKQRVKDLEAMADRLVPERSFAVRAISKAVELFATNRGERYDTLEREPVVSDPGVRWSLYEPGKEPERHGPYARVPRAGVARRALGLPVEVQRRRVAGEPPRVRVEEPLVEESVEEKRHLPVVEVR